MIPLKKSKTFSSFPLVGSPSVPKRSSSRRVLASYKSMNSNIDNCGNDTFKNINSNIDNGGNDTRDSMETSSCESPAMGRRIPLRNFFE